MPRAITRDEVRAFLAREAQLVDVLPAEEYAEEHLLGAINIPIKTLDAESTARLRRDRAVIVYCHDLQ
jgi:rhodanese-related sulfurtransferase